MRRAVVTAFAALALAATSAAGAGAGRADEIIAFYRASWAGLPAAEVRLKFSQSGEHYHDEVHIETKGLSRWITRFRGDAASEGRFATGGAAAPSHYEARYDLRKWHDVRVSMSFVARDGATVAERSAEENRRKPPLAERYRQNVLDPISAVVAIRERLRAGLPAPGSRFSVPVYDGARRFDVAVEVEPAEDGKKDIRLKLVLRPIAGFKGASGEDGDPDNSPRPAEATFSGDGRLVPLSLSVSVVFLPLVVRFDHFCASYADCGGGKS